jgi:hypothetical protein
MYEYVVQICHIFSTKVGPTAAPIAPHSWCRCVRCGNVQKDGFGVQLVTRLQKHHKDWWGPHV